MPETTAEERAGLKTWAESERHHFWPNCVLALLRDLDAADRFKVFVHTYLDQHGVPADDPENEHSKAGCRIGARLDLLFQKWPDAYAAGRSEDEGERAHGALAAAKEEPIGPERIPEAD